MRISSQKSKYRFFFFVNSKSIKIITITAFVNKKNMKYSTKCKSLHILRFYFLIWNSPEAVQYDYLMLFEYIILYNFMCAWNASYFQKKKIIKYLNQCAFWFSYSSSLFDETFYGGVQLESRWSSDGVQVEFTWSPNIFNTNMWVWVCSRWSPGGLQVIAGVHLESTWTRWGKVKYTLLSKLKIYSIETTFVTGTFWGGLFLKSL